MNVFLASTPYHIILSLLFEKRNADDAIILIDQFGTLQDFSNLNTSQEKYFYLPSVRKKILDRIFSLNSLFRNFFYTKNKSVLFDLNQLNIESIFVFNDSSPEAQFFLRNLHSKEIIYIEDGTAPYNSHQLDVSRLSKLRDIIYYGFDYERVDRLGNSKYIQSGLFTFPKYASVHDKSITIGEYKLAGDWRRTLDKFSAHFSSSISPLIVNINQSSALILLPSLHLLKSSHVAFQYFQQAIERLLSNHYSVILKFHPLDQDLRCNIFDSRCIFAPSHVPAEILMNTVSSVDTVIGDYTTGLLSCRFLFPEKHAISLHWRQNKYDKKLIAFFRNIDVEVRQVLS